MSFSRFGALLVFIACVPACLQDGLEPTPDHMDGDPGSLVPFSEQPPPPPPPPCVGQQCNGLDPHTTGCDVSAAADLAFPYCYIYNGDTQIALVEMRYSYGCGTKWTRTTTYINGVISLRAIIKRSDGLIYQETVQPPGYNQIWSDMLYEPSGGPDSALSRGRIRTQLLDLSCITASSL